jgi:phosphotriesterase-related protein
MSHDLSDAHVRSGKVMTVTGPVPVDQLGMTLMHEHILNDCRCWWHAPKTRERQYLAESFVCIEILGELRQDPFVNRHNITLDDEPLAIAELQAFAAEGGRTVVVRASAAIRAPCGASLRQQGSTS